MAGLVPAIHELRGGSCLPGTRPGMTEEKHPHAGTLGNLEALY
jgi:hypothetical protein